MGGTWVETLHPTPTHPPIATRPVFAPPTPRSGVRGAGRLAWVAWVAWVETVGERLAIWYSSVEVVSGGAWGGNEADERHSTGELATDDAGLP